MFIRGAHKNGDGSHEPLTIPAGTTRRMAKLQRATCDKVVAELNRTGVRRLEGIYAGTALGCLEDTQKFLDEITGPSTSLRSPLPFMRSTHNTMAGQLALLLKVTGPNITYSQGVFGFHAALLDAMLHVEEQPSSSVLAFAADEQTEMSKQLMGALMTDGQLPLGEGVEAFVLGGNPSSTDVARITHIEQGHADNKERWTELLGTKYNGKSVEVILWSSFPNGDPLSPIPVGSATEQYDLQTGNHGAQTAQALSMIIARIVDGSVNGPCAILDRFGDRVGLIVVGPC